MSFEDIDKAFGWIEILSCHNLGIFFCRSQDEVMRTDFEKLDWQKCRGGWSAPVDRKDLWLRSPEPSFSRDTKRQQGSALLPEEERIIFLWQSSGEIIVASEDRSWNKILEQALLSPEMIIDRPGNSTFLWRLPMGSLALG